MQINSYKIYFFLIFMFSFIFFEPTFGADSENILVGVWKYKGKNADRVCSNPIINFKSDRTLIYSMPTSWTNPDNIEIFGNAQYKYKYFMYPCGFNYTNNYKGRYKLTNNQKSLQFSLINRRLLERRNSLGARYELVKYKNILITYRITKTNKGEFLILSSTSLDSLKENPIVGENGVYKRLTYNELLHYNKSLKHMGIKDLQFDIEEEFIEHAKKIKWISSEVKQVIKLGPIIKIYVNISGKKTRIEKFDSRFSIIDFKLRVVDIGDIVVWKPISPLDDPNGALFKVVPDKTIKVVFDTKRFKK